MQLSVIFITIATLATATFASPVSEVDSCVSYLVTLGD